ncbi:MAG: hypothetical protein IVW56_05100 [Candidatus Binataceae bacterium]|nr:hypothetical protein [Candidatus Binataceae bacterium]
METVAIIVGWASGFALTHFHGPAAGLLATSLAIDAALAPLTAVIAARRGRSPLIWALAGFPFGMWALAAALIIRPRPPSAAGLPDASGPRAPDAA